MTQMKAKGFGILSALTASICCLGPLLLIALGLGSLGLGAFLGKYHWYFILAAALLLGLGWYGYFKEKRSCESAHCQMQGKNITRTVLTVATLVVMTFTGLNVYTFARGISKESLSTSGVRISIPVKGMTCFTCEVTVQQALKKLPGIMDAKASAKEGVAMVSYDPQKISLNQIIETINKTGYEAEKPEP
jgi:copper chaperone CopZ